MTDTHKKIEFILTSILTTLLTASLIGVVGAGFSKFNELYTMVQDQKVLLKELSQQQIAINNSVQQFAQVNRDAITHLENEFAILENKLEDHRKLDMHPGTVARINRLEVLVARKR